MIPAAKDPQIILEHFHRYLLAKRFCEGKTVLDIACGEGYGSRILAEVATQVTGVDIDDKTVRQAAAKYKNHNILFKKGDAVRIPVDDNSIDVVVSFETLEHLAAQHEMMKEFKRVLRNDGLVIISTPDKKYYSDETGFRNEFHLKELYSGEFRQLLEKYFSPVRLFSQFADSLSVIYPFENQAIRDHWYAEGFLDDYQVRKDIPAHYLIGIAGGTDKTYYEFSIFNGKQLKERMNQNELTGILNSRTYRLGKALTSPYRWLKRIFSSG